MALKSPCPDTGTTGGRRHVLPCALQRKRGRITNVEFEAAIPALCGETVVLHTTSPQSWRPTAPHQAPAGGTAQALRAAVDTNKGQKKYHRQRHL